MLRINKHIYFIFLLLAVVSCTAPEDDSPSSVVPQSITDEEFRFEYDIEEDFIRSEEENPIPSMINDDEDDESGPTNDRRS